MTPQDHYDKAERLLESAGRASSDPEQKILLQTAQVHATLALATPPKGYKINVINDAAPGRRNG